MKPILELTTLELADMPEHIQMGLQMRVSSNAGIQSTTELSARIHELVHLHSMLNQPVMLSSLTRRFSKSAKQFGVNISDLIWQLIDAGKLQTYSRGGRVLLISSARRAEQIECAESVGDTPGNMLETFLSNSPA